jgi:predicted dehydrogenase
MPYNMGIIGIGHWFERLYEGILKSEAITLKHAASASGYELKKEQLKRIGISEEDYYRIDGSNPIPSAFFNGIDVVHISDPNEFHAEQTLQSLSNGKVTITEKTFGINRAEFEKVASYISKNKLENKAYLHLHYAHKLLTIYLPDMLEKFVNRYGKIVSSSATFFEAAPQEVHKRRLWLFSPNNGGLFMDWIHPFEVYYKGASATEMRITEATNYSVDHSYGTEHPTGVHAVISLKGNYFAHGAAAHIRIAKGIRPEYQKEMMRFIFEGDQCLDLSFMHSEVEFITNQRGMWELRDVVDGKVIDSACPRGPTSSDILVNDMVALCSGVNQGFSMADLKAIFDPQWQYQDKFASEAVVNEIARVNKFVKDGLENSTG